MAWRLFLTVLFACLLTVGGAARSEPRFALVIGNGAYGAMGPLRNPPADARMISSTLQQAGFKVDLQIDTDQKSMRRAVQALAERVRAAGGRATALFYYAGHGLQSRGTNYLIPVGSVITSEGDLELEAVAADAVLASIEQAGPATIVMVLDACRDTPVWRASRSAQRGLARIEAPRGSYVAYSTAPGQTAQDGDGTNSPYARALAAEMLTPGLDIEVMFRRVRRAVVADTQGRQTPWDSSSLVDSFYFRPAGSTVVSRSSVVTSAVSAAVDCTACPHMTAMKGTALAFATTEVTRGQWDSCVQAGACAALSGEGAPELPAAGMTWPEAKAYTDWLAQISGRAFRLPTLQEWQAARTLDGAPATIAPSRRLRAAGTMGVGASGLADLNGSVSEWTSNCAGTAVGSCSDRVAAGGSWREPGSSTATYPASARGDALGLRVVEEVGK